MPNETATVNVAFVSRLRRARESLANAELLLAQGRIAGTITVLANAEDEIRAARIRLLVGVEPVGDTGAGDAVEAFRG